MSKRGKKDCPNCNTEVGARCHFCPDCNFDFISAKKEKLEKKEEKEEKPVKEKYIDPRVKELYSLSPYEAPDRLSSVEHAERILSYGVKRSKLLLALALNLKCWSHVDWQVVKQGL